METHILILLAISGLFSYSQASLPPTECSTSYDKVGGFIDKADRAMPELLINDGKVAEGKTFEESVHSLACRCAAKAKEKGYKVFGLQNIVECWSGPDAEANYNKYGMAEASKFYQFDGKPPCDKSKEQECVGGPWANYVYRLKEAEPCLSALGMQDKTIPDSSITASSMWDANHSPSRARLGTVKEGAKRGGWSAKTSNVNQWIQVDLGKVVKVTRIATQGRQDYGQWVKSYSLQYSLDGGHFEDYQGGRVLTGNSDRNSIVGHSLEPAIIARYIRIRPKSWHGHISLRFEIYGCT